MCPGERGVRTVGEHARGRELDVGQRSQVVEHSAPVALPLGVIHKGADVVLLAVVADARTDHHGEVICIEERKNNKKKNKSKQCLSVADRGAFALRSAIQIHCNDNT